VRPAAGDEKGEPLFDLSTYQVGDFQTKIYEPFLRIDRDEIE